MCVWSGGSWGLRWGEGQLAWEPNSWSSSETLGKSLPPWWPTSLRHKNGWLENLVGPLQLSLPAPLPRAVMPPWAQAHSPAPSHPPTKYTSQATGELNLCPDGTERGPYRTLAGSPHRATEEGENWRWSDVDPFDNDHFVSASKEPGTGLSLPAARPKTSPGPWGGFLSSVSRVCSHGSVQRAGAN